MTRTGPTLAYADIDWSDDGQPISHHHPFLDRDIGLVESGAAFIDHNDFSHRWQDPSTLHNGAFVIGEIGFGIGLNFLAAWQCWRNTPAAQQGVLHLVATERAPLHRADLQRALARFPELAPLASALCEAYPPPVAGLHRLRFDGGRVLLSLAFGEAATQLAEMHFVADAWFLNALASGLESAQQTTALLTEIASHSRTGSSFSAHRTDSTLEHALRECGFTITQGRQSGIVHGSYESATRLPTTSTAPPRAQRVAIIGAGLAGAHTARRLAERGLKVSVFDRADRPGQAASGNVQGALYIKPGVHWDTRTQLSIAGLLYSQRQFADLALQDASLWHGCGLLQLAWTDKEQARQTKLCRLSPYPAAVLVPVSAEEASRLAGLTLPHGGLYYPSAGWAHPPALCDHLLNHPNIDFHPHNTVTALTFIGSQWRLHSTNTIRGDFDVVVICAAADSATLLPDAPALPLNAIRGQVSRIAAGPLQTLRTVLCADGYLPPPQDNKQLLGASFDLDDSNPEVTLASHVENLAKIAAWVGETGTYLKSVSPELAEGRVAFRCTLPDHQPACGQWIDTTRLQDACRAGLSATDALAQSRLAGLYVNLGHGSRGLSTAPLLSEALADEISGQPSAISRSLRALVDPGRFALREQSLLLKSAQQGTP